jgi:hypothetical protein
MEFRFCLHTAGLAHDGVATGIGAPSGNLPMLISQTTPILDLVKSAQTRQSRWRTQDSSAQCCDSGVTRRHRLSTPKRTVALGTSGAKAIDVEKNIAEIELLERIYTMPDKRGAVPAACRAVDQKHDAMDAKNPWLWLWKHIQRVSAIWRHK